MFFCNSVNINGSESDKFTSSEIQELVKAEIDKLK